MATLQKAYTLIKKIYDSFSRPPMMVAAGIFLLLSLIQIFFPIFPIDPAWVTILICGTPLVVLALERVFRQFFISSALLISIAMFAAIYIGEIFAAGEVVFIMAIGAWLEDRTVEKTKRGIEKLINLVPNEARRIATKPDGTIREETVAAKDLQIGDIVRILPGEKIIADGVISKGETSVDQSVMTGESLPVDKGKGDEVYTGTVNCYGSMDVEVKKAFADSSLQKMIALVREAENKQAPMQKIVDKVAQWLVPLACLIAFAGYAFTHDLVRAVTVLVVFCPCALALATPVSIVAAIGQATKFGVLIKSGEALEKMGKVTVAAFDKTGTLTKGRLQVTDVIPFSVSKEKLLSYAAACENRSEHPIGKAIAAYAKEKAIAVPEPANFAMQMGKGVSASIEGEKMICGNERLLAEQGIPITADAAAMILSQRRQGKATVIAAKGNTVIGIIALSDVLRENAQTALASLKKAGITRTVLLTGDNQEAALAIAAQTEITDIKAGLLPEDKADAIAALEKEGSMVAMLGDGVNDAAALKTASVGIAMGTMGSDIAIDAADIALMGDDISKIPYIKKLANATIRNIKVNITISMIINFFAIALSLLGILNPITGALVHNAGSVLVVMNAARLYNRTIDKNTAPPTSPALATETV